MAPDQKSSAEVKWKPPSLDFKSYILNINFCIIKISASTNGAQFGGKNKRAIKMKQIIFLLEQETNSFQLKAKSPNQ